MNGNVGHVVHILYVGMAHEVLLQVIEHVAATTHGALIHIRADLLAHTLVDTLCVCRDSPCLLGNESGGEGIHAHLLNSRTVPVGVNKAHLLVQAVHQFLLITASGLVGYSHSVGQRLSQNQEVFVGHGLQLFFGGHELVVFYHA